MGLLFGNLPRRCVVLLEDIDSAGLIREEELPQILEKAKDNDKTKNEDKDKEEVPDTDTGSSASIGLQIVKALKSVSDRGPMKADPDKGISLSGLLNAIDGVASHEGRVLVMTTNHPEKLDDALIRPGRVDMKVAFTMATRSQIQQLFVRMYSPDVRSKTVGKTNTKMIKPAVLTSDSTSALDYGKDPTSVANLYSRIPALLSTPPTTPKEEQTKSTAPTKPLQIADIEAIAIAFADKLPEDTLTPAEIQGFLLTRKKEPRRALEEVETWRDELLEAKKERAKEKEGKGDEAKGKDGKVDEAKDSEVNGIEVGEEDGKTETKEDEEESEEKMEEAKVDEKLVNGETTNREMINGEVANGVP